MTSTAYPSLPCPSNTEGALTPAEYLTLASTELAQEAATSRKDSAKLRCLAQSLEFIAVLLSERAGSHAHRKRFVLEPRAREEMIAIVWIKGSLSDDEGKRMELVL